MPGPIPIFTNRTDTLRSGWGRRWLVLSLCALPWWAALPAQAATTLEIGDQKGNAQAILEASGALQGADYQVEWHEFASAAPLLEALRVGSLDAGSVGDAPLTFAIAAGLEAKALSAYHSDGLSIIVPGDADIHSVGDLAGKRIGVARGSVGHLIVLDQLGKAGLSADDVSLVYLTPAEASLALSRGDVDAVGTWEPYVSFSAKQQGTRELATLRSRTYLVASDTALAGKRAALDDFAERLARAREWGREHRQAYAEAFAKVTGLPLDVAAATIECNDNTPEPISAEVVARQQNVIDLYQRAGLIPTHLDAHDFFAERP
ncbi:ABC transporter substrate-binding protein [Halotalea alkalilenta]|uniref:ABC transporter substrate-binding protein n=1 Tax=Halotalea alkalilenta TaxID=376489 RepID=UPI000694DBAF|nr:ABC transporter substrate-binding protein [Halotalea alkalilenta]